MSKYLIHSTENIGYKSRIFNRRYNCVNPAYSQQGRGHYNTVWGVIAQSSASLYRGIWGAIPPVGSSLQGQKPWSGCPEAENNLKT